MEFLLLIDCFRVIDFAWFEITSPVTDITIVYFKSFYLIKCLYLGVEFITHVLSKVVNFIWCLRGCGKMTQQFDVGISSIQLFARGKFLSGSFVGLRAINVNVEQWQAT